MLLEATVRTGRHTSHALVAGPADGPLLIFVHGWPELAISWRHQLHAFAALGYRCIAPDMRGYGRSTLHPQTSDYALEHAVADMLELLAAQGRERAIWIGHDWGSPVVWSLAQHHPERVIAAANLCVPYFASGFTLEAIAATVDRARYPAAEFPYGQWEYQAFYQEHFARAVAVFEADVSASVRCLFRAGSGAARAQPARTALTRRDGGWFGGADRAPDLPMDPGVLDAEALSCYVAALTRNGFAGPDSWYLNHAANGAYAARAKAPRLAMPVLFLHAAHDMVCDTTGSTLAEPMRRDCADLTEVVVPSGHWMAQEQPVAVNATLARWLAARVPGA